MNVLTSYSPNEFTNLITQTVTAAVQFELSKLQLDSAAPTQKQFFSRQETAEMLGISLVTLDSYVKRGFIIAFRVGFKVRFNYTDILQALAKINVGG